LAQNWEDFKHKYESNINSFKKLLNITIYGSYHPEEDLNLLERLRDILINDGYDNTALVTDRPTDVDSLEVSQQSLIFSDINLFVFTRTGKRFGIIDELASLTLVKELFVKIPFSMVFDQVEGERSSIPDLSMKRTEKNGIQRREFSTGEQLEQIIVKETYWLMRKWVKFKKS
jgi:hypothetical protein